MRYCFFAIILPFVIGAGSAALAQGQMKFSKVRHEFGEVPEGPKASYTFEFTNTGNQPVQISSVRASCGCTTPRWSKEPVAPGETGTIQAVYNTSGRPGQFRKSITIRSNAKEKTKVLHISGQVVKKPEYTKEELAQSPRIELNRKEFVLGKSEIGQPSKVVVEVSNKGQSPLKIKSLRSDCNCVRFQMEQKAIEPGESAPLVLKLTPKRSGQYNERALLYTNDLHERQTTLRFKGKAVKELTETSPLRQGRGSVPFK